MKHKETSQKDFHNKIINGPIKLSETQFEEEPAICRIIVRMLLIFALGVLAGFVLAMLL